MGVKYFCKDVNDNTTCDEAGVTNLDLNLTQGTPTTQISDTTAGETFESILTFMYELLDPDAHAVTGDHDCSIDVTVASPAAEFEYRFLIATRNGACAASGTTRTGSAFTGTGIKTETIVNKDIVAGARHLRFVIQGRRPTGHGNKSLTMNVNDSDSFDRVPWGTSPQLKHPIRDYQHILVR